MKLRKYVALFCVAHRCSCRACVAFAMVAVGKFCQGLLLELSLALFACRLLAKSVAAGSRQPAAASIEANLICHKMPGRHLICFVELELL